MERTERHASCPETGNDTTSNGSALDRALDSLRIEPRLGDRWEGARHSWIKHLLPAQKGRVGEKLFNGAATTAGCAVTPRTKGNDTTVNGHRVEVKTGTLHDNPPGEPDIIEWLQLRPGDEFEQVALLGVCPEHTHLWVVNRNDVLTRARGQHGGAAATETLSLRIDPHNAPDWLGADLAASPAELAGRFPAPTTDGTT